MANEVLSVRLPQEVIDKLDRLAQAWKMSRAQALIECLGVIDEEEDRPSAIARNVHPIAGDPQMQVCGRVISFSGGKRCAQRKGHPGGCTPDKAKLLSSSKRT